MKHTLLLTAILLTAVTASAGPQGQLLAHYPLDGDAIDASGQDGHGVVLGATAAADFRELAGDALAFDGVDDLVDLPSIGDWGTELTLSFWLYASSAPAPRQQTVLGSRAVGGGPTLINFAISLENDGTMTWLIGSEGTESTLSTTEALPLDRWVHVLCDWSDGGTMRIRWDGRTLASGPAGSPPRYLATHLGLGNFCDGCGDGETPLDGRLDEVRIYSRLLTDGEAATLAGRLATFTLDGGTLDSSGHGRHATAFGALATSDRLGAADAAYAFDGEDDLLDVPTLGNWGAELAFSMWLYADPASFGETLTLVGSRNPGSGSTPVNLAISILGDASLRWRIFSNGDESTAVTEPGAIGAGRWIHVACDWSQLTATMRIFLNGRLVTSGPIGGAPRYQEESLGLGNWGAGYSSTVTPFHGSIDEVYVFSRVLTVPEIEHAASAFFADGFESGNLARWASSQGSP